MRIGAPILPAYVTPATGIRSAQAHLWCQHCEAVHTHSAVPGHRCAHCFRKESLYGATGYDLEIRGAAGSDRAALPEGPYVGRRRLWEALTSATPRLRSAVLAAVLGSRGGYGVEKRIGRARVSVLGHGWWVDLDAYAPGGGLAQGRRRTGRDLITLLACLFGIDCGLAGLRLLEAASGAAFSTEDRCAIAAAIERAYAGKADGRDGVS